MNHPDTAKAFLAGALLPSIAFYFWHVLFQTKRLSEHSNSCAKEGSNNNNNNNRSDNNDDDDDDDDENSSDGALFEQVEIEPGILPCKKWGLSQAPYKMMLIVNTELNMGKGKIAAQCGHAAVGCYQRAIRQCPSALSAWERTGCAKIALKCPTTEELENIATKAMSKGIPFYLVEDAGRTQIAAGSRTVVGLFGPASIFEGITDHLKLM